MGGFFGTEAGWRRCVEGFFFLEGKGEERGVEVLYQSKERGGVDGFLFYFIFCGKIRKGGEV